MTEWEWAHVVIGAVASGIFLFQTFGVAGRGVDSDGCDVPDSDMDMDCAGSSGGLSDYLSIRNFVAFFIGYGWVTLAALLSGASKIASSMMGMLAGFAFIAASLYMIRAFLKMQEDGSLKVESLVGRGASVYIAIAASGSAQGKVMVDTKAGRVELPARTKDAFKLQPGEWVKIIGHENGILWVTKEEAKEEQQSE